MSNRLKRKYIGRYIGIKSPKDGVLIENITCLNKMLEQDNLYALLGKTSFDWSFVVNEEWSILKVYSTKESLLSKNNGCNQLSDRIYTANWIKRIHID